MNFIDFRQYLKTAQHRSLCILSGSQNWQFQQIRKLYQAPEMLTWIDSQPPIAFKKDFSEIDVQSLEAERLKYHLGQEIDTAILDIQNGLSANQLGILSGMIKAGGLLILLVPDNQWWKIENPATKRFLNTPLQPKDAFSHFYQHLYQTWQESNCIWLSEDQSIEKHFLDSTPRSKPLCLSTSHLTLTDEQQQALEKIHSVAFGHRKRPLVLSADRGRGKSSLLGVSAIEQLLKGKQHIVMTASRFDQIAKAFEQAKNWLQNSLNAENSCELAKLDLRKGKIVFTAQQQTKVLEFIAPDQLVLEPTTADMLMVDEAAFLPTPLLTELLKRHHRMVFATTLHGYEGSGRGFELRFKKTLNELTPGWKSFHINQPVRWAENDPLEIATNQALLLNAKQTKTAPPQTFNFKEALDSKQLKLNNYTSSELLSQPKLLNNIFALLVQAHYQTSPNDLQQLLSSPNIKITACLFENTPVGICLSIEEGGLPTQSDQLQGHLTPQLLSRFYAQPTFITLKSWRIMRITVHPDWQAKQIGSYLVKSILEKAKASKIDYVSSSFGVTPELFRFWQKLHFRALHIGTKRDKASGQHNLIVAHPISALSQKYLSIIQQEFEQQFPHLLIESLPYLAPQLAWQLLASFRIQSGFHQRQNVLRAFANKAQTYDALSAKLWKSSLTLGNSMQKLPHQKQEIWCDKILKKQDWQTVAHHYHLPGKKSVETHLLDTAKLLLEQ